MEVTMGRMSKYFRAYFAVLVLLLGTTTLGCTPTTRVLHAKEELLSEGIPADSGLIFGRIEVEGGWLALSKSDETNMDFRN